MYVLNKEKRLIILGDGVRVKGPNGEGGAPGQGTKLYPGRGVDINEVPQPQRDRFLLCVKRQIERGRDLEILESAPNGETSGDQIEALRVKKNLDKLSELTVEPEVDEPGDGPEEAPVRRRGRKRKEPLGGAVGGSTGDSD